MKVERQGAQGCVLSTIAALSGVPLSRVESYAYGLLREPVLSKTIISGVPLSNLNFAQVTDPVCFWGLIAHTARTFEVPMEVLMPPNENKMAEMRHLTVHIPRRGKGAVTFSIKSHATEVRHICPFENGLVFDPEANDDERNGGETLGRYLDRMRSESWVREIRVVHVGKI